MPQLTINDDLVECRVGLTVLEAATRQGIVIPTLCHHADLSPVGSCRMCLVEVDSIDGQVAACTLQAEDGMRVRTESDAFAKSRRMVLQLLLRRYRRPDKLAAGENELERWARHYDVPILSSSNDELLGATRYPIDSDDNPFIRVDLNQCILCTRCVRACEEIQGRFVLGVGDRGEHSHIVAGAGTSMLDARCESCGACAAYCPTGALSDRMRVGQPEPDRSVVTTCSYCGVGCQFRLEVKQDQIVSVASHPEAAVNGMSLCVKGRYGWDYVHHRDRLLVPRVRSHVLDGRLRSAGEERSGWVDVDWDTALEVVARNLIRIKQEHSANAIGVLSSAKCTNEENYLIQKLARQVFGTHNVDHCARLCHSSTVAGLSMAVGSGAMSNSMRDIAEQSQALFVIGSNTTEQHPVFGAMLRQAVLRRNVPLVVADPRRIDLTEFATLHLRHRPGTDVALINGIMHVTLINKWHDVTFIDKRCEGFAELCASLEIYSPEYVAKITGVSALQIREAAEILATNRPMATIWAMGITQHTTGVMNVLALANLQMLLGNLGIPGGGVNPLRGQNNVQGACDMGALPNVFPGYQSVTDAAALQKFSEAWRCSNDAGVDLREISAGLTVTEMIEAAGQRGLRGLYILGEDPAMTEPDSNHARECLTNAEFVVLQEIFPSETARYCDVLLPGTSFAEKDGTFTNTERRVQLVRQAIPPMGDARPDWKIIAQLAQEMMRLENRTSVGPDAAWQYADTGEIMGEVARLTPIYAGVSHHRLIQGEQLQWPVRDERHEGTPILHVGEFTRGKGRFHAVDYLPPQEVPDSLFPLVMTTGRVLYHWHGGELTRRSTGLMSVYPETLLEIDASDAHRLGIGDGSMVRVSSRRGVMVAKAHLSARVFPGVVFGNFHFPAASNVNNVTIAALDPIAKIPEFKVCAVRVERC
ncbi:MAG: formate dehydrogenase subunit alpha [Planctomycetota bacterium]|nr:formate dehydrogenase subunit alpha [Planctomycetota bacterium]